jgi:hypothetical protein
MAADSPEAAETAEARQSITGDRTSALVAGGLVLLAVVGVATVFSNAIAAAWSPATETSAAPVATTNPGARVNARPVNAAGDGGSLEP